MDRGGIWTEMYIAKMEKRIKEVYSEAEKDIEKKMLEFNRNFKIKRDIHIKDVREGRWTQEEYNRWRAGQMFQGKQWKAKKEQIAQTLHDANKTAAKIANEQKANVFAINANYQAYLLEHGTGINFGFGLYDSATVVNLIKSEPQVLPYYTPKKSKDMPWNMRNITRQVTQGIIQGEKLEDVAKRIAKVTGSRNMNSMLTQARTGMTMAQNAGRQLRLKEAEEKGIKVQKEWMATLDKHTRWQHADLDGQKKPLNEPFRIGEYSIMYPGDPLAHPAMVYNCRCTLVGSLDDYPAEYERYDNISGKPIKNMTYREWEAAKNGVTIPQFTQVGIGSAKSVKEVNDILNRAGVFTTECDLTGCDLDSAKSVAAAYEQVFSRFPNLKGKFRGVDAHPVGMEDNVYAWCYLRNGGKVQVNPKMYNNWMSVVMGYENDVLSGWHPEGTTAESIVTHEIGHAIDGLLAQEGILGGYTKSGEFRYASSSLKNTIMKRAAKLDPEIANELEIDKWLNDNATVYHYVSKYATKNNKEWFAECFAEYITSANPRTVASEFGKELERLVSKIK